MKIKLSELRQIIREEIHNVDEKWFNRIKKDLKTIKKSKNGIYTALFKDGSSAIINTNVNKITSNDKHRDLTGPDLEKFKSNLPYSADGILKKLNEEIQLTEKAMNEKDKIIARLVKSGHNKKDAEKMVNSEYEYVAKTYSNAPVAKKADIITRIYGVTGVER